MSFSMYYLQPVVAVTDNRSYKDLIKLLCDQVSEIIQNILNQSVNGIKGLFGCLGNKKTLYSCLTWPKGNFMYIKELNEINEIAKFQWNMEMTISLRFR